MNSAPAVEASKRVLKVYARTGLWIALLVSLLWTVSIILAPLTISPGSVAGLSGAANRVDYGDLWGQLPPAQGLVYLLGDVECHQISARTIYLNGNEMPVCARDASLFLFFTIGLALAAVVKPHLSVSRAIVRMLPARLRGRLEKGSRPAVFSWFLGILSIAPLGIDATIQLLTPYESTNATRFLTGIPAGMFVGLVLGLTIQSIHLLPSLRHSTPSQGQ